MSFRHLDYPSDTPVEALGAAAIDDLLDRGDLEDWAPLARHVLRDPWGDLAETVIRLCGAHPMYGTSSLWLDWIARLRARPASSETGTLSELRAQARLTQEQIAQRMGIAQSDVSKLERRADMKLSTLRAFVDALGGVLDITVRLPEIEEPVRFRMPSNAPRRSGWPMA